MSTGDKGSSGIDLARTEAILGHTFTDPARALVALNPSVRGFSRLEFLGDAVIGLAVFAAAECSGVERPAAIHAVSNQRFDELFRATFASCCRADTGDVIEALMGALHLDAGFDTAAHLGLELVLPGVLLPPASPSTAAGATAGGLRFIGAAVLSAVVADHLCTVEPDRPHAWLHDERSRLLRRDRVGPLARRYGLAETTPASGHRANAHASDRLEEEMARRFLTDGWVPTRAACGELLELG